MLEILQNPDDFQPLAIETAKAELESRQDVEAAKNELREKTTQTQIKTDANKQKRQVIKNKAYKVLEYADPFVQKTPEKSITLICIIFFIIFLYKTITGFDMIASAFKEISTGNFSVYWFLLEFLYLPVAIVFLWRKTRTGWIMFLVWLIYQNILDCLGLYMCYQLSDIPDSFPTLMPLPNLSQYLFQLAFHGGLTYFICRPKVRALFPNNPNHKPETEEAKT